MGVKLLFARHLLSALCLFLFLATVASANPTKPARYNLGGIFPHDLHRSQLEKKLSSEETEAVVCIPGLSLLLLFLCTGSGGVTFSACASAYDTEPDRPAMIEMLDKDGSALRKTPGAHYDVAIYAAKGVTLKKEFVETGEKFLDSRSQNIDFAQKEQAVEEINSWAEKQTGSMIKDFIKEDDLKEKPALMIMNAISFKGKWQKPFNPADTVEGDFRVSETENIKVKLMSQTGEFMHVESELFDLLAMPIEETDLLAVILLPKDPCMPVSEINFNKDLWSSDVIGMKSVHVTMPQFKIETTIDLDEILSDNKDEHPLVDLPLDLSGISDTPLRLFNLIQKTVIEFNHEGIDSASATNTVGVPLSAMSGSDDDGAIEFKVDRPFRFVITSLESDSQPLFAGLVSEPHSSA